MTTEEFVKAIREGARPPARGIMIYSTSHTLKESKWDAMAQVYQELGAGSP